MKRLYFPALLACALAALSVSAQPAPYRDFGGVPQFTIAFNGGSVWTSSSTGTCIWYFPVLSNLPASSLFAPDSAGGPPMIDLQHSYLIWVSDWQIQGIPFSGGGLVGPEMTMALIPLGSATIYYSDNPASRNFKDTGQRTSWGTPVARFNRGSGLLYSPDATFSTDNFYFTAQLVESHRVRLGHVSFDFRDLVPQGMTCFEYGQKGSTTETGACMTTVH